MCATFLRHPVYVVSSMRFDSRSLWLFTVDLHIPAVHVPGLYCLLWVLGVVSGSQVPGLSAVGTVHTWQLDAQRTSGSERDRRLHGHFRSRVLIVRHRTQHRRAYFSLCQVAC